MSLTLYYHPLASFCHKVLIALCEAEKPFAAPKTSPEVGAIGDRSDLARTMDLSRLAENRQGPEFSRGKGARCGGDEFHTSRGPNPDIKTVI